MDLTTLLGLLHLDPALLPVNAGLVVVLVAWLRDPVEELLPQAGPTAQLNGFWLKSLNLILQLSVLIIEYVISGGAYTLQAAAMLVFAALLCAFVADAGYQAVNKAIASSQARAANASAAGDTPLPAPAPISASASDVSASVFPAGGFQIVPSSPQSGSLVISSTATAPAVAPAVATNTSAI